MKLRLFTYVQIKNWFDSGTKFDSQTEIGLSIFLIGAVEPFACYGGVIKKASTAIIKKMLSQILVRLSN